MPTQHTKRFHARIMNAFDYATRIFIQQTTPILVKLRIIPLRNLFGIAPQMLEFRFAYHSFT